MNSLSENESPSAQAPPLKGRPIHPPLQRPENYPQITNGGEKRDERPQARFANGAILSKGFSSQESHRCDEQGSHPGELSPSKTSSASCGKRLGQSMPPTRPEVQMQRLGQQDAQVLDGKANAVAASALPWVTKALTDASNALHFGLDAPQCDIPF